MTINKINVTVNGVSYTSWENVEVDIDMEQMGRAFSIQTSIPNEETISIKTGDAILIDIDQESTITGFIDTISIKEGERDSSVSIVGRDKISDFIDSRVSSKNFATPVGFQDILESLLELIGYEIVTSNGFGFKLPSLSFSNKISVINNYGDIDDFATNEGIYFSAAEEAYDLIRRLADKRGIVLGTNGDGNITIDSIAPSSTSTALLRLTSSSSLNNIKNPFVKDSVANRFNEYKIISGGTGGPASVNFESGQDPINNDLVSYSATVYDSDIRSTRRFLGKISGMNNSQCSDRAAWELNIRKAKDFVYTCDVVGFRQNLNPVSSIGPVDNPLWQVNRLVYLKDERYGLDNNYLIKRVQYKQSNEEGSITKLTLVDKNSYTYSLYEPKFKQGKSKQLISFSRNEV